MPVTGVLPLPFVPMAASRCSPACSPSASAEHPSPRHRGPADPLRPPEHLAPLRHTSGASVRTCGTSSSRESPDWSRSPVRDGELGDVGTYLAGRRPRVTCSTLPTRGDGSRHVWRTSSTVPERPPVVLVGRTVSVEACGSPGRRRQNRWSSSRSYEAGAPRDEGGSGVFRRLSPAIALPRAPATVRDSVGDLAACRARAPVRRRQACRGSSRSCHGRSSTRSRCTTVEMTGWSSTKASRPRWPCSTCGRGPGGRVDHLGWSAGRSRVRPVRRRRPG